MSDNNFPTKSYQRNGWTISKNGNIWQAVNPRGEVGMGNVHENLVQGFAKKNDASKKLT